MSQKESASCGEQDADQTLKIKQQSYDNRAGRQMVRDLRIRRLASRRLAVLTCGHSDPWRRSTEPPSEKMVTAGREAAEHLAACGLTPILGVSTLRGLWLRGGRDRQLAELLHRLCE